MGKVKLVLNKRAFQEEVLYNPKLGKACADAFQPGSEEPVVEDSDNSRAGGRVRARVYGDLAEEAASGYLSARLGGGSKVRYTTRDGRQRWATQKQVDHWTRNKKRR